MAGLGTASEHALAAPNTGLSDDELLAVVQRPCTPEALLTDAQEGDGSIVRALDEAIERQLIDAADVAAMDAPESLKNYLLARLGQRPSYDRDGTTPFGLPAAKPRDGQPLQDRIIAAGTSQDPGARHFRRHARRRLTRHARRLRSTAIPRRPAQRGAGRRCAGRPRHRRAARSTRAGPDADQADSDPPLACGRRSRRAAR